MGTPANTRSNTGLALSLAHRPWLSLILLALATLTGYWNTLDVPFYFDDFRAIIENPAVHDPTDWGAIWAYSPARFVGGLSFAFNYTLGEAEPAGYHIVNTLIHFLAATALWFFLAGLVRSPVLGGEPAPRWRVWVPLIAALMFVLHPLQTQAVTYIVQRFTSLAALWYLTALAAFTWGRLKSDWRWFLLSAVFTLLAFLTKQNAATLPGALVLIELLFFRRLGGKGRGAVAAATLALFGALPLMIQHPELDGMLRETWEISRVDYLATQLGILWHYIGLIFVPVDQRLEYAVPLVTEPWPALVYIQMAGHVSLIATGFLLWTRAPLVAFGILFYYLAHLIESSIFPITDLAVEHRTYLPNVGAFVATAAALAWFLDKPRLWPAGVVSILAIMSIAGWLTHQRNELWRDPIAFLQEDVRLSPDVERAWTSLGKEQMRRGQFKEALYAFGNALNLSRTEDGLEVRPSTLANTVMALHYTGQHKKAFNMARLLPMDSLEPVEQSRVYEVRGNALLTLNQLDLARQELEKSLSAWSNPNTLAAMAVLEYRQGNSDKAKDLAVRVLNAVPQHPMATNLLRKIEFGGNRPD